MSVPASELTQMVKMLTEEDYIVVIKYIDFLISSREKNKSTIRKIQKMFTDDKGWISEEAMLSDMAAFHRLRLV